jgi:hypothetical protein
MVARAALALVVLAGTLLAATAPAAACSCAARSLEEWGAFTDVGFVGTLVEISPSDMGSLFDNRFTVEEWTHGNRTGSEVVLVGAPGLVSSCDLEIEIGERVAVFAERRPDCELAGALCGRMSGGVVSEQRWPTDPVAGAARVVAIGAFPLGQLAYFGGGGSFLGYSAPGDGTGRAIAVAACRGADLAVLHSGAGQVWLVDLAAAEIVDYPFGEPDYSGSRIGGWPLPIDVSCVDGRVTELVEHIADGLQVRPSFLGPPDLDALDPAGVLLAGRAVIGWNAERVTVHGRDGSRVLAEPQVGEIRHVRTSDGGQRLVMLESRWENEPLSRVRWFDVESGTEEGSIEFDRVDYRVEWVTEGRIAVMGYGQDDGWVDVISAETARVVGSVDRAAEVEGAVLLDGILWTVSGGRVERAQLGGSPELAFTLPTEGPVTLIALESPVPRNQDPERSRAAADVDDEPVPATSLGTATGEPSSASVDDRRATPDPGGSAWPWSAAGRLSSWSGRQPSLRRGDTADSG